MQQKKAMRQELLKKRDSLDEEACRRGEILITERILGHQWFYRSEILLGFMSYGSEIRTGQILEEALRKGKKVFLPRVEGDEMSFYLYDGDLGSLRIGYKGIREPSGESEKYEFREEEADRTLLIMPGVGFDPYRNRLGYGKGFYDRFLADKPALQLRSIAIGHSCQMVDRIPSQDTDIRPYQVILV